MHSRYSLLGLLAFAIATLGPLPVRSSEPAPEEFAGLKWRATQAEVKAAMVAKGSKPVDKWETPSKLVFETGKLAGLGVDFWDIDFANGQFWRGVATFTNSAPNEKIFKVVKNLLSEKYGPPKRESSKPLMAVWTLDNFKTREGVTITLHPRGDITRIQLDYQNDAMKKHVRPEEDAGAPNPSGL